MKALCAALTVTCILLTGCSIIASTDKDTRTDGQKLENSADSAKQKM